MKIVFTGGATGGHFYPLIAIADAIIDISTQQKILTPAMYYIAPTPYNPRALFDRHIEFIPIQAGKYRRYFSILNITDTFKTLSGIIRSIIVLYKIYPDVIISKGGYASFPPLCAARFLRIPVIIHESDSVPGIVTKWSAPFAQKIAISYPQALKYFRKKDTQKIAVTGNPMREAILQPLTHGAYEHFNLDTSLPTLLILGGSQGAQPINDILIESLPELVQKYQIIHQTGRANFTHVQQMSRVVLKDNQNAYRYHIVDYLNDLSMRLAAGIATLVISRAGSTIFEIAAWGKPSIIIPLREEVSHDQTKNAFSYAETGACKVIEEHNLSTAILVTEIDQILQNQKVYDTMKMHTQGFAQTDAAHKIARGALEIGLSHEK